LAVLGEQITLLKKWNFFILKLLIFRAKLF
jgi:hypothetical protein